jgi:hypothetical protein
VNVSGEGGRGEDSATVPGRLARVVRRQVEVDDGGSGPDRSRSGHRVAKGRLDHPCDWLARLEAVLSVNLLRAVLPERCPLPLALSNLSKRRPSKTRNATRFLRSFRLLLPLRYPISHPIPSLLTLATRVRLTTRHPNLHSSRSSFFPF